MEIDNSYGEYDADFRSELYYAIDNSFWETRWVETDNPNIKIVVTFNDYSKSFLIGLVDVDQYNSSEYHENDFLIGIIEILPIGDVGELKNVYEPHSYIDKDHRGKGLMKSLYTWVLDNGMTLMSCGTQTKYSNGLWKGIKKHNRLYQFGYIEHSNWKILKKPSKKKIKQYGVRTFMRRKNASPAIS